MSDCINEALSLFRLNNAKVTLLRHTENRTYRIDCDEKSYCRRIKNPVSGFDLSCRMAFNYLQIYQMNKNK